MLENWLSERAAPGAVPTPETAARLGDAWLRRGLMEHASVAAFARFALQLMALGAPADLIEATTRAMQDESRHARLCFSLAERFSGRRRGPGPLDVSGALDARDLEAVVRTAFEEGCVGETMAALEAAHALEHCRDEATRRVLEGIVRDENEHARLAWRFVAWALEREPRLRETLREQVARTLAASPTPARPDAGELLAWGVVDEELHPRLRRRALEQTVLPCARHLLGLDSVTKAA